jgi:hypothetical protein
MTGNLLLYVCPLSSRFFPLGSILMSVGLHSALEDADRRGVDSHHVMVIDDQ